MHFFYPVKSETRHLPSVARASVESHCPYASPSILRDFVTQFEQLPTVQLQ